MLHHKSKPDDIVHYISQMEMLLLSSQEKEHITQLMGLEKLIKEDTIKDLILEDLPNDKWLKDTQIIIDACYRKIEKSMIVQKHIEQCKNFIVYRILEEKVFLTEIEVHKQITGWNFNEIDKHGEKTKWVSQKFMRVFETSEMYHGFEQLLTENNVLTINSRWLHQNRALFFTEEIFGDLNKKLKKQKFSLNTELV